MGDVVDLANHSKSEPSKRKGWSPERWRRFRQRRGRGRSKTGESAPTAATREMKSSATATVGWRGSIEVHPAADLLPATDKDELAELGKNIRKHGLNSPIILWQANQSEAAVVLDGRNRLDALELELGRPVRIVPTIFGAHIEVDDDDGESISVTDLIGPGTLPLSEVVTVLDSSTDPFAYVISANLHRRHLTAEQKGEVIEKLLKAMPERSDRQIAELADASPTTVGKKRTTLEASGDVSTVDTRTDKRGRQQPARKKSRRKEKTEATTEANATAIEESAADTAAAAPETPADAAPPPAGANELERLRVEVVELRRLVGAHESRIEDLKSETHLKTELGKLDVMELLRLLSDATKAALKNRVIEHLTAEELLDALERKAPSSPRAKKAKAAIAARDDVGAGSSVENARLSARVDELADKRRLEIANLGLHSEISELKASAAATKPEAQDLAVPADDGIPDFLRRAPNGEAR